jgi:hypothetical protein
VPTKHPITNPHQNVAAMTQGHPVGSRTNAPAIINSQTACFIGQGSRSDTPRIPLTIQSSCFRSEGLPVQPPAAFKSRNAQMGHLQPSAKAPLLHFILTNSPTLASIYSTILSNVGVHD